MHTPPKHFFLLLVFLSSFSLSAQKGIDSLRLLAEVLEPGPELHDVLADAAVYYQMRNNDSMYYYADKLWQLGHTTDDIVAKFRSRLIVGSFQHNHGNLEQGRRTFHEALAIAKEHNLERQIGFAFLDIGLSHSRGFNLDSAYYYFQEAEKRFLANGEEESVWKCYNGYGNINDKRQDYEAADQNYRDAMAALPANASKADRGYVLYSVFAYAILRKRFDLMYEVSVSWDEYKGANSFDIDVLQKPEHFSLFRMLAMEDVDIEEVLYAAAAYHRETGNTYKLGSVYHDLGTLYEDRGKYQKSKEAFETADRLYTQVGYNSYIVAIRTRLAMYYEEEGNYQKALNFTRLSHAVIDSLRNAEAERNFKRYQVEFETEKKEQALRINQLELDQKTQERNIWLGSSVFLALLAISIFGGARQRIRQRELLAAQEAAIQEEKIQRLEQEKRLLALSSMIEGQEQERRRIAKDLHDGMGGLLTTIKAHYNTVAEAVADTEKFQEVVPQTGALIDRACTEVRRISQNMMPAALLYAGLEGALEDLAVQVRTSGVACDLELVGDLNAMEEARTVAIYRILQEAVNNILKHAQATHVLIQLIAHGDELHMTVEDNGKGFEFEEALHKKSVGLKSFSSRVQYLKGSWHVDSVPGEGTTISFNVPLSENYVNS